MAFQPGRSGKILVNQYNVSAYFRDLEYALKADTGDTSTFGGTWHTHLSLLKDGQVKLGGLFDPTTGGSTDVLSTAFGASAARVYSHFPMDDTIGNPARLVSARESEYTEKQAVAGLVELNATIMSDGGADPGFSQKALSAETSSTNSTSIDNAASSSNGGVAHLHVTAYSGLTNAIFKIQHSTDNSVWADLATFATITAVGSERVVVATGTTVNRYTRAISTLSGSGSVTWQASFARR